ncbi:MAG: hypothetical protein ABSE73_29115 [Planctomycetota bacterium]
MAATGENIPAPGSYNSQLLQSVTEGEFDEKPSVMSTFPFGNNVAP